MARLFALTTDPQPPVALDCDPAITVTLRALSDAEKADAGAVGRPSTLGSRLAADCETRVAEAGEGADPQAIREAFEEGLDEVEHRALTRHRTWTHRYMLAIVQRGLVAMEPESPEWADDVHRLRVMLECGHRILALSSVGEEGKAQSSSPSG